MLSNLHVNLTQPPNSCINEILSTPFRNNAEERTKVVPKLTQIEDTNTRASPSASKAEGFNPYFTSYLRGLLSEEKEYFQ